MSLWFLFLSAFISSTLLPGGSEAVLAYLADASPGQALLLVAVATLGNTLGGMSSWGVGRFLIWRFPARQLRREHEQAIERLRRWGAPVLLLSWLPVVGDPLCVAAGWLKVRWPLALLLIGVGKAVRYAVIVWLIR